MMKLSKTHIRVISIGLLLIAVLQIFQDQIGIKIDTTTVLLIGLAILLYIMPDINNLSKFKYGDVELEFEKDVDRIEKLVVAEEVALESKPLVEGSQSKIDWQHYYAEYREITSANTSNIEKILRASQLVELMITEAGKDFEVEGKSPRQIMQNLHKNELISKVEYDLFLEFQALRNKVIHGEIKEINDGLTVRILDILWRIVRTFG